MKFKEWFNLDETRYGGLWARWKAQNPNVPEYILKQMYINHISPGMRNELDPDWSLNKPTQPQQLSPQNNQNLLPKNNNMSNALTAVYQDPQNPLKNVNQTATVGWIPKQMNNLPSDVINQRNMLNGIKWNKKPKIVSVTPLSFDQRTIRTFIGWQFGYNAIKHVRDDANRTQTQRKLASERKDGENEPIIMVEIGNGSYQLLEGFHRTASYLLQGAPKDQIEIIKNGQMEHLNFNTWMPIKIKAYIGKMDNSDQYFPNQNQTNQPQMANANSNRPAV